MMRSYEIQHDCLFVSKEMANNKPVSFNIPKNMTELNKAIPAKALLFLGKEGKTMLKGFSASGEPILLLDNTPKSENPIISAYSVLLIKGIATYFQDKGISVFKK